MPHRTQSEYVHALDPFGFLGGSQPEESAARATPTSPPASTIPKSESSSEKHEPTASSASGTSSTMTTTSNNIVGTPGHDTVQPSWTSTSVSQISDNGATPTDQLTPKQTAGSTNQASSGMNSWKIIGIGIVTFVGILTLIIGFTFHDTWWDKLLRPAILGKRDKNVGFGEVLIPDWKRRSWRFNIEEKEGADRYPSDPSLVRVNMTQGLHSKSTLVNEDELDEKPRGPDGSQLSFPLPPISPFPLRREPSTKSDSDSAFKHQESNQNDSSILPSPPPVHAQNRSSLKAIGLPSMLQYGAKDSGDDISSKMSDERRKSRSSLRVTRNDLGQTSSIYGGIV